MPRYTKAPRWLCVSHILLFNGYHGLLCCATNRKVAGSIPAGVSGFFIDIKSFRSHYGSGVDSASNRNEYQKYFLGGKGGRCVRLTTYHHPVPLSRNLGTLTSWNPLGPSGPVTGMLYLFYLFTMVFFPGLNRPGRETNHSPQSSAKVKNELSCTYTCPHVPMACTGTTTYNRYKRNHRR